MPCRVLVVPCRVLLQRMPGDGEEQEDELLVLSTILDTAAFAHLSTDPHRGSIKVQVGLLPPSSTFHLPPATCHLPPATCHLPPVTCTPEKDQSNKIEQSKT